MNLSLYLLGILWIAVITLILINILRAHIQGKIVLLSEELTAYYWKYKEDRKWFILALILNYFFLFVFVWSLQLIFSVLEYYFKK